ncbi:MAG: methyltransferase [Polyangiales bacterium]
MSQPEPTLPPPALLTNLLGGKMVTHALGTFADLRVADHLAEGPRSASELAPLVGAQPDALYRVCRALGMFGVLVEHEGQCFSLTPVGALLRSDVPGSMRDMAVFWGQGWHSSAWGGLTHAVKTGEPGFPAVHGASVWQWLATHAEPAAVFDRAMTSFSSMVAQAVVDAYDFTRFARVADIGGGHGALLAALIAGSSAQGVLFDRPEVVAGAAALLAGHASASRIEIVGGDFFAGVPDGCDAYVLKHVVHDWNDEASVRILRHCAAGLRPGGRVLLVEMVVPPIGEPSFAKLLDLEMLVVADAGKERTEAEFGALLAQAGLRLTRVVPTASPVFVIEAERT